VKATKCRPGVAPTIHAVLGILQVTFPFFALVLCGYLAARRRMLPLDAIGGLNTFVLYFALPCLLYRFGAGTPIGSCWIRQRRWWSTCPARC
jgi:hypothetical protein